MREKRSVRKGRQAVKTAQEATRVKKGEGGLGHGKGEVKK